MNGVRMTGNVAASEFISVIRERDRLADQLELRTSENLIYRSAWNTLEGMLTKMQVIEAAGDISPLLMAIREATRQVNDEEPTNLLIALIEMVQATEHFIADGHAELVFAMTDDMVGRTAYRQMATATVAAHDALTKVGLR